MSRSNSRNSAALRENAGNGQQSGNRLGGTPAASASGGNRGTPIASAGNRSNKAASGAGNERFDRHEAIAKTSYCVPGFDGDVKYAEHPMLHNKPCYSMNFPKGQRDFRWREDDRDTGNGRCKVSSDICSSARHFHFSPNLQPDTMRS